MTANKRGAPELRLVGYRDATTGKFYGILPPQAQKKQASIEACHFLLFYFWLLSKLTFSAILTQHKPGKWCSPKSNSRHYCREPNEQDLSKQVMKHPMER